MKKKYSLAVVIDCARKSDDQWVIYEIQYLPSSQVCKNLFDVLYPIEKKYFMTTDSCSSDGGMKEQIGVKVITRAGVIEDRDNFSASDLLVVDSSFGRQGLPDFPGVVVCHDWFLRLLCNNKAVSRLVLRSCNPAVVPPFVILPSDITQQDILDRLLYDELQLTHRDARVFVKNHSGTKGKSNAEMTFADFLIEPTAQVRSSSEVFLLEKAVGACSRGVGALNEVDVIKAAALIAVAATSVAAYGDVSAVAFLPFAVMMFYCAHDLYRKSTFFTTHRLAVFQQPNNNMSVASVFSETHPGFDSHDKASKMRKHGKLIDVPVVKDLCQRLQDFDVEYWLSQSLKSLSESEGSDLGQLTLPVRGEVAALRMVISAYLKHFVGLYLQYTRDHNEKFLNDHGGQICGLINCIFSYNGLLQIVSSQQTGKDLTRAVLLALLTQSNQFLGFVNTAVGDVSVLPALSSSRYSLYLDLEFVANGQQKRILGFEHRDLSVAIEDAGYLTP